MIFINFYQIILLYNYLYLLTKCQYLIEYHIFYNIYHNYFY